MRGRKSVIMFNGMYNTLGLKQKVELSMSFCEQAFNAEKARFGVTTIRTYLAPSTRFVHSVKVAATDFVRGRRK